MVSPRTAVTKVKFFKNSGQLLILLMCLNKDIPFSFSVHNHQSNGLLLE